MDKIGRIREIDERRTYLFHRMKAATAMGNIAYATGLEWIRDDLERERAGLVAAFTLPKAANDNEPTKE